MSSVRSPVKELAKIPGVTFVKNNAAFYVFPKLDKKMFASQKR